MKTEKTFALVVGGVVQNIIVADQAFIDTIKANYDAVPEATGTVAYIGGEYKNGAFVPMPVPKP